MRLRITTPDSGGPFDLPVTDDRKLLLAGRRKCCDVVVQGADYADVHVELRRTKHGWLFKNRAVNEPLYLNNQWVTHGVLYEGDTLRFRDARIEVVSLALQEAQEAPYVTGFRPSPMMPKRSATWWQVIKEEPQKIVLAIALVTAMPVIAAFLLADSLTVRDWTSSGAPVNAAPGEGSSAHWDSTREQRDQVLIIPEEEIALYNEITEVMNSDLPDYERLGILDEMRPLCQMNYTRNHLDQSSLELRRALSARILERFSDLRFELRSEAFMGEVAALDEFEQMLEKSKYHQQIAVGTGILEEIQTIRHRLND
jgi:hypothetical protein